MFSEWSSLTSTWRSSRNLKTYSKVVEGGGKAVRWIFGLPFELCAHFPLPFVIDSVMVNICFEVYAQWSLENQEHKNYPTCFSIPRPYERSNIE